MQQTMKTAAVILILSSAFMLGLERNRELKGRMKMLTELIKATERLHCELEATSPAMPELIEVMQSFEGSVGAFFKALSVSLRLREDVPFNVLWRELSEKSFGELNKDALDSVASLGAYLGRYELSGQLSQLSRCREILSACLAREQEEYTSRCKLNICLPLSAAAAALIILI